MTTRRSRWLFLLMIALSASWALAQQRQPAQTAASELDDYVRGFRFSELASRVPELPASLQRDYFAGVLANREGRSGDSVVLLEKALPQLRSSNPRRAAVALESLADDYVKLYRYADAIRAYQELLQNFPGQLDKAERRSATDDSQAVALLKDVPAQSISFSGPVELTLHRNPVLDTLDAELTVGGVTAPWILDTGANFTTVSASFARRLGVRLSQGKAQTQGITGAENKLQIGILPELNLGGAVVRNVVLLVLEDSNLNVPSGEHTRYQINAILGYPVLHALQRITFTRDGHFLAGPDSPSVHDGARLFMNDLTPLLECTVDGRPVLFHLDTGANTSFFSDRYYREFPSAFSGLKKQPYRMGGAGGIRKLDVYYLPHAQLGVGTTLATLNDVPAMPSLGTHQDKVFGNLGRDLTDAYRSFTIDWVKMRLELGEKLPEPAAPKR